MRTNAEPGYTPSPFDGGIAEQERHQHWRTETLKLYQNTFQTNAPPQFWDDDKLPPPHKGNFLTRLFKTAPAALLLLPFLLTGCDKNDVSSHLPGLIFILFIGIISAAVPKNDGKKKSDGCSSGGDGCSSGGDSGGCGGGCGGCGGD